MGNETFNYLDFPESIEVEHRLRVPAGKQIERLDTYLVRHLKNVSRTKIQKAIENNDVTINGIPAKANKKVKPNDVIVCILRRLPPITLIPENIPLDVYYEDDYLMVVNKPAGMVTHPGYGNRHRTLVNAVLFHLGYRENIEIENELDDECENDEGPIFASDKVRPGIVHRLDKDTSGLILISKNPEIHQQLAQQFFERTIERYYYAIVWGELKETQGTLTGNIGRSPKDRKLFAVVRKGGKPATTNYWLEEKFQYLSLVRLKLQTGRTHQIRVHLSHNKHSLLGDKSYGGDSIVYGGHNTRFKRFASNLLKSIERQMLHAKVLGFYHPIKKQFLRFESEYPEDMKLAINKLRKYSQNYL